MNPYLKLLRLLNKIEKLIQAEILSLINLLRSELMEISTNVSRSELIDIASRMIDLLRLPVGNIVDSYTAEIIEAINEFTQSQDAPIDEVLTIRRIGAFVLNSQQWIQAMSLLVYQAIANESVDLTRSLFSKQITQDDVSAIRKSTNSMRLNTQFALFAFANGVIIDAYQKEQSKSNVKLRKMAIAKLDDTTTDTCKSVHRQTVFIDQKFRLSNRPRFAKLMDMPPFHWNCRTSAILIRSKSEEKLLRDQLSTS